MGSGDGVHQPVPYACFPPSYEAVVAGGAGAIAFGQVAPRCAGAQHPEDAVQRPPVIDTRHASRFPGQQRLNHAPLEVGQVITAHAAAESSSDGQWRTSYVIAVSMGEAAVARDDWYRNATWDDDIEAIFEQRLRRARDKSQYLRIQASYLAESHPPVALKLIERYFELGEHFDIAQAHVDRARAMLALGNLEGALASYEAALERELQSPFLRTQAYLDYGCLVVEAGPIELYARALEVLDAHQDRPMFPVDRYRAHGARAILLHHFTRIEDARAEACLAMKAAQETNSGFRYHPNLGLVQATQTAFAKRVAALSA